MVLVRKRSSNMMDSPKKLSNGSMHFSYNLQEGRSPKNLSNNITPEASKNLNYRADKQNYITGLVMMSFRVKPKKRKLHCKTDFDIFTKLLPFCYEFFPPIYLIREQHTMMPKKLF